MMKIQLLYFTENGKEFFNNLLLTNDFSKEDKEKGTLKIVEKDISPLLNNFSSSECLDAKELEIYLKSTHLDHFFIELLPIQENKQELSSDVVSFVNLLSSLKDSTKSLSFSLILSNHHLWPNSIQNDFFNLVKNKLPKTNFFESSLNPSFYRNRLNDSYFKKHFHEQPTGIKEKKKENDLTAIHYSEIYELQKELSDLMVQLDGEVFRVKKIHQKIVPKRYEDYKGIKILSKYGIGEGPGGEFFDIIKSGHKLFIILSSTSSYIISGIVLGHFNIIREKSNLNLSHMEEFIEKIHSEILRGQLFSNSKTNKRPPLQLLVLEMDLKTLVMRGYLIGSFLLLSNSNHYIEGKGEVLGVHDLSKFFVQISLKKDDRIAIVSPGLKECSKDIMEAKSYDEFFTEKLNYSFSDIPDEIFFKIKDNLNSSEGILKYDASLILLEIQRNIIKEVK